MALGLIKLDAQLFLALTQLEFLVLQRVDLLVEGEYLIEELALLLLQQRQDVLCHRLRVAAATTLCSCALDRCSVLVAWRCLAPAEDLIAAPRTLYPGLGFLAAESAHGNKIVKVV